MNLGELRDAVCALPVVHAAVQHLQSLGASVVELSLPEMEEVRVAHVICILSEMRDFLQPDFNKHFQEMVSSSFHQCQYLSQLIQMDRISASHA